MKRTMEGIALSPEQRQLVQSSFAKVAPIAETAASLFYDRLFTLDPRLRLLFKGDMKEQGRKLMAMIGAAVRGLDQVEALVPVVRDLGRRHAGYGVGDADYDTVALERAVSRQRRSGSRPFKPLPLSPARP